MHFAWFKRIPDHFRKNLNHKDTRNKIVPSIRSIRVRKASQQKEHVYAKLRYNRMAPTFVVPGHRRPCMLRTSFSLNRLTVCGLVVLCSMITVQAQFRAGVQGTISDSSGALVPEAKIVLKHAETGKIQEAKSSEEGFYRIVGLAPGRYSLTVEKTGYKTSLSENVTVAAESVQGVDVILETGEITATVTITDEAVAQLETENANVSKAITPEEVKRLPQAAGVTFL